MTEFISRARPGRWRRTKLLASTLVVTAGTFGAVAITTALPARASGAATGVVVTSNFIIGSPTGAVTNLSLAVSPSTPSTSAIWAVSLTSPNAIAAGGTLTLSAGASNLASMTSIGSATLYDVSAGWIETASPTSSALAPGGSVSFVMVGTYAVVAGDTLRLMFNAINPSTGGSYGFTFSTSGNSTPAATNPVSIAAAATVTVSPSAAADSQTLQFTISDIPVVTTGNAAEGYLDVFANQVSGGFVTWLPSAYTITDKTAAGPTQTSSGIVTAGEIVICSGVECEVVLPLTNSQTMITGDTLTVTLYGTGPSAEGAVVAFGTEPASSTSGAAAGSFEPPSNSTANETTFGTSVAGVAVSPSPNNAGASAAYSVSLTVETAWSASNNTITLTEATGGTNFSSANGWVVTDASRNEFNSGTTFVLQSATSLTIMANLSTLPARGDAMTVTVTKVVNPAAVGTVSDFTVATTTDPVAANATPYGIVAASTVTTTSPATVAASPNSAGYLSTWTISNLEASASIAVSAATGTIQISGDSSNSNCTTCGGLVFPNYPADYTITDLTTASGSGTVTTLVSGGGTDDVTIEVPAAINRGDIFSLRITNAVNPSSASSVDSLALGSNGAAAANDLLAGDNNQLQAITTTTPTTTTVPTTTTLPHPSVVLLTTKATVSKSVLHLELRCSGSVCRGTIKLWYENVLLVSPPRAYSLGAGNTAIFPTLLDVKALKFLAKAKNHTITVGETVFVTGGATMRKQVTLVS
ncbi:MAG TPA: hypothetical protein VED59_01680 [Acidimicrobiales bacterium]|nr:hypothetical protein [Acidimicrobiales bacterium]